MNEIFDQLIVRFILSIFLLGLLVLYRYAHAIFYPTSRSQIFKNFYPSHNPADTLHFFSRLIGIGILFEALYFNIEQGLLLAIIYFMIHAIAAFTLYLLSIYVLESISLFNFEYQDEIIKRKNMAYALICFSQGITLAFIIRMLLIQSHNSVIILLFLWLLAIVLFGLGHKFYFYFSILSFNKLLIQKNLAVGLSYSGHLFGRGIILIAAFDHPFDNIETYSIKVILKILLASIILPIFQKGPKYIFNFQDDIHHFDSFEKGGPNWGYGLYEGGIFFLSSYLTSIIIGHIIFGSFYPL